MRRGTTINLGGPVTKKYLLLFLLAIIMALAAVMAYKALAPLPAPIPPRGQVLDAATGKAISGAQLKTRWRIYDYPMLDGAGSYELSSVTVTDDKGHFSLVIPDHRRGIWNTETYPPTITAVGYKPFAFDDANAVQYGDGESIAIKLTPEEREGREPYPAVRSNAP